MDLAILERETASIARRVRGPPSDATQSDRELKREIEDELFWSPFVDEHEVQVEVDNGWATLRGTVDSWSERAAASENAYEGGAAWVVNRLEVAPPTSS